MKLLDYQNKKTEEFKKLLGDSAVAHCIKEISAGRTCIKTFIVIDEDSNKYLDDLLRLHELADHGMSCDLLFDGYMEALNDCSVRTMEEPL